MDRSRVRVEYLLYNRMRHKYLVSLFLPVQRSGILSQRHDDSKCSDSPQGEGKTGSDPIIK
jgi:hypothetical protein